MTVYGLKIARTYEPDKPRDMIAAPERSMSGNVIVPTGIEITVNGGWTKTGHVVLTADEARCLAAALVVAADDSKWLASK